jgi:hydroxymethylbilane synthase
MKKIIRLGTRGSPLALIQAEQIRLRLLQAHADLRSDTDIEIIPIRTTGDWRPEHQERRFVEMGGNKGLFTKEIEEALLANYIDMAVHSMKDVDSTLAPELDIGAIIVRADPRDAFIGSKAQTLSDLPSGAVIGTSSLRRQAQILALRPDIRVVPLRGNVETRLKKLEDGMADATILAVAGMTRLSVEHRISSILPTSTMLPAAAQGALGVEIRKNDEATRALLAPLNDFETSVCVEAERAVMRAVDGNCHTPAGAYATLLANGQLALEAIVARADGTNLLRLAATGPVADAEQIGERLGLTLRQRSPKDLFAA